MKTQLSESTLMQMRADNKAVNDGPFPDPHVISQSLRVLDERGEEWAASVLGRDISRRSLGVPAYPHLTSGEPRLLVVADMAEDRVVVAQMEAQFK